MKKILVPTDGSAESEKALSIAEQIAAAQNAELLLVRVVEPMSATLAAAGGEVSPDAFAEFTNAIESEARTNMAALAERVGKIGAVVRTSILRGPVEMALLECETTEQPDLVVMTTHGRTGIARFALGSVTDRLLKEGTSPVLVLRRASAADAKIERALLMLDGSGVAEESFAIVRELRGKPIKSLTLYRVVADPQDRAAAMTYLEGAAKKIAGDGVEVTWTVAIGEPRHVIERAAKDVDVVILCTHGRTGFDRLRHGSVAEFVMRQLETPALLLRTGATAAR